MPQLMKLATHMHENVIIVLLIIKTDHSTRIIATVVNILEVDNLTKSKSVMWWTQLTVIVTVTRLYENYFYYRIC